MPLKAYFQSDSPFIAGGKDETIKCKINWNLCNYVGVNIDGQFIAS
jgi:hypothetical protein